MGKDKNLPSFFRRVCLEDVFKPVDLFLVNSNFVRSVFGFTKDGRSQTDQKRLVSNLTNELRTGFSVSTKE